MKNNWKLNTTTSITDDEIKDVIENGLSIEDENFLDSLREKNN